MLSRFFFLGGVYISESIGTLVSHVIIHIFIQSFFFICLIVGCSIRDQVFDPNLECEVQQHPLRGQSPGRFDSVSCKFAGKPGFYFLSWLHKE